MDENGETKQATISDHVLTLDQTQACREDQLRFKLKADGEQLDDLFSYNQLMEYSQRTLWTLHKLKMDPPNSSLFKTTEAHILILNTLVVVSTYLLNGKLGR